MYTCANIYQPLFSQEPTKQLRSYHQHALTHTVTHTYLLMRNDSYRFS